MSRAQPYVYGQDDETDPEWDPEPFEVSGHLGNSQFGRWWAQSIQVGDCPHEDGAPGEGAFLDDEDDDSEEDWDPEEIEGRDERYCVSEIADAGVDDNWDPEPFEGRDEPACPGEPVGIDIEDDMGDEPFDPEDYEAQSEANNAEAFRRWQELRASPSENLAADQYGDECGYVDFNEAAANLPARHSAGASIPAIASPQSAPSLDPVASYLSTQAPSGAKSQACALRQIAAFLGGPGTHPSDIDWPSVGYGQINALRTHLLGRGLAPRTVKRCLSAVKRVRYECYRLDLIDYESYQRSIDVAPVRGNSKRKGRALSVAEIRALFAACEADPNRSIGARDAAMFALLLGAALRRGELCALALDDFDAASGEVTVRNGKGGDYRSVYIAGWAAQLVSQWIAVRGNQFGPLVGPAHKAGATRVATLSGEAVNTRIKVRSGEAGIKAVSAHDFRRTAASMMLASHDPFAVQSVLGHQQVTTTFIYDLRGEDAQRSASLSIGKYLFPEKDKAEQWARSSPRVRSSTR